MERSSWILEDLDLEMMRNLVVSYSERDPEISVLALRRIRSVVESEATEIKDWLKLMKLPSDEHPLPVLSEEEEETVALITQVIDLIEMIDCDFGMLKNDLGKWDPDCAPQGVFTRRFLLGNARLRMLKRFDELVLKERRAQKAQDLREMIFTTMSKTVNKRMVGVVVGLFKSPNKVESIEKLKRIEKCLCHVLGIGRAFILTHRFMPQPKSFPVAQLSESQSMEQGSPTSSAFRLLVNADALNDQVFDCLGLIVDCAFHKLGMNQLELVEELVIKMSSALEKTVVAKGAVYLED